MKGRFTCFRHIQPLIFLLFFGTSQLLCTIYTVCFAYFYAKTTNILIDRKKKNYFFLCVLGHLFLPLLRKWKIIRTFAVMATRKHKTYKHLLFCGDVHGEADVIPNYIRDHELEKCAVFQLGDFGVGFAPRRKDARWLKYMNDRMKNSDSDLFVLRGNHDDPSYFNGNTNLSNLHLLKDYTVTTINSTWNVLCVGGAISIDRTNRPGYLHGQGGGYWKNENIYLDEEKANKLRDIDIVCTHSAPNFCMPLTKGGLEEWKIADPALETDVALERHQLSMLYEILSENNNISEWYYGHFHNDYKSYRGNTIFEGLSIGRIAYSSLVYPSREDA